MIEWFVRNGVAANLLMVLILALGIHALFFRITLEILPGTEPATVSISVTYRGATPVEMEEGIVTRIEEAISGLAGIERIVSEARAGNARIEAQIEDGEDPRALLDDIKSRVDAISTFPGDAERPIYSVPQRHREIISVAVSGDLPERGLRALGERVREDLLALPDITQVDLMGVRPYEIAIEVSQHTLERFGIGFDDVVDAIRAASGDYPAGSLKTHRGEILLRTRGQAYTGEDFGRIVLFARSDGARLTLADIAHIEDGFAETPLTTRFNGRPAVLLKLYRVGDQSAFTMARQVRDYVEGIRAHLPPGVHIDYWRDFSRNARLRVETLTSSAIQGGLLIFMLLGLFLRLSVAMWVCVGIPISFMGALILMPNLGGTINSYSLFGFILALGVVVDDAIVTGESIHTHLKGGEDSTLAAIRGAREVAGPVTFGVLTTMVAFVPLLFIEGRRGQLLAQIAIVVIPVLLFSLIESKLILPAHMRHIPMGSGGEEPKGWLTGIQRRVADALERGIRSYYRPLLLRALEYRFLTLALFVGVSFVLVSFAASGRYGFTFFPRIQSELARATVAMPAGTPVAVTRAHTERMLEIGRGLQDKYRDASGESVIRNIFFQIGWTRERAADLKKSGGGYSHIGRVTMALVPPDERTLDITTSQLVREWRRAIGPIPGAREVYFRSSIGGGGDPIDIQLMGDDFEDLTAVAAQVKARLAQYSGVFDIRDSFDAGREEIKLTLRPEAELLGLSTADLGKQVRHAFFGAEVQRIQRGRDDVRVMVHYPLAERRSEESLANMRIRTPAGVEVPFNAVAEVTVGAGFSTIRRVDRHRAINVTADLDEEKTDLNRIMADMQGFLSELRGDRPQVHYSLEGEMREQRESMASLVAGILFVLFAVYALLAIPLRSYLQPLLVMFIIPFSVIGALLGHMIMGMNLTMMSLLGLLALIGVVVNNALVLVDYIDLRVEKGVDVTEAVSMAGVARSRPILLTSVTTFAGLMPLLLDTSTQAQFLIPMAVSLGFGILYATVLTLFLVPVSYLILEDATGLVRKRPARWDRNRR
uniref:Multidrug efflux pump subunit AcrB n=1 Tax=Candidatus Kentrum sp. FM TaxID=2126340 RepID=A0A450TC60_9GAMM|nr:MAG: Multidrug efflux pump subunit AcrB [Candidatus Kentron sp. FM]VFJ64412.1 MAG: Multidrug efflux pump subunit AcrB [Candidatus Kentron sp. FM]VFK15035.1 MAG: Multidrug efflux pump subunit AcrB [Candidatus Kentron sp. FM]